MMQITKKQKLLSKHPVPKLSVMIITMMDLTLTHTFVDFDVSLIHTRIAFARNLVVSTHVESVTLLSLRN
jgi:hypothetical protein